MFKQVRIIFEQARTMFEQAQKMFEQARLKKVILRSILIACFAHKPAKFQAIHIVGRKLVQIARNKIWVVRHIRGLNNV